MNPRAAEIIAMVAEATGVPADAITGPSRRRSATLARFLAIGIIRDNTVLSLAEIGVLFSDRDHTTILYSVDQFKTNLKSDPIFRAMYERAVKSLGRLLVVPARKPPPGQSTPRRVMKPSEIVCAVADAANVDLDDLLGTGRTAKVVGARRVAVVLLREMTHLSYPEIARTLCLPNHSTAIWAMRRYEGGRPCEWTNAVEARAREALGILTA